MEPSRSRARGAAQLLALCQLLLMAATGGGAANTPKPAKRKPKRRRLAHIIREYQEALEESENPDLKSLVADFCVAIDQHGLQVDQQEGSPVSEDSYAMTADLLATQYQKRSEEGGQAIKRNRTVGTSLDEETYIVFNAIVSEFAARKKPGVLVGQMIEKFILTARPQVRLLYEASHPGKHDARCSIDPKYGSIFSWTPRYVLPDGDDLT